MCGIVGFIGYSTNPKATAALTTAAFRHLESRGTDASGFWGTEKGNGRVLYHKEPVRSSAFVKTDSWKEALSLDPDLFLAHARGASLGYGSPADNRNNHPFVSTDKQVALIHNGRINEYNNLTKKYMVNSDCDSEVLLRIFEAGSRDETLEGRLCGIQDIYSHVITGHMAVAIGERRDVGRRLWLFRNQFRSLWIIDLRKMLGQIFFCSTPEIWQQAMYDCSSVWSSVRRKSNFIEVRRDEIWGFSLETGKNISVEKYQVHEMGLSDFKYDGKPIAIIDKEPACEVVTDLGENEQPKTPTLVPAPSRVIRYPATPAQRAKAERRVTPMYDRDGDDDDWDEGDDRGEDRYDEELEEMANEESVEEAFNNFEKIWQRFIRMTEDFYTIMQNKKQDGSLNDYEDVDDMVQAIEETTDELEEFINRLR